MKADMPAPVGSSQNNLIGARGQVRGSMPLDGVPCFCCGRPAQWMTLHPRLRAIWPCGHSIPHPSTAPGL